jgi:hypothetical protein
MGIADIVAALRGQPAQQAGPAMGDMVALPDVGAPLMGSGPQVSTGMPWANRAADIGSRAVGNVVQGQTQLVTAPGAIAQPNPYPPGSEEAAWYDQDRQSKIAHLAPAAAYALITGGMGGAEAGALGMAGGRTVMPGAVPLRGPGGAFLKPMTDARGLPNAFIPESAGYKVVKPGEVAPTSEPSNAMYTDANAPDPAALDALLQRRQTDQLSVNPNDVGYWKSRMDALASPHSPVASYEAARANGTVSPQAFENLTNGLRQTPTYPAAREPVMGDMVAHPDVERAMDAIRSALQVR